MEDYKIHYNSIVRIHTHNRSLDWFQPHLHQKKKSAIGTGVFIDRNGHILTCSHVVEDSIQIYISIPGVGRQKFTAEIISIYPDVDLAIIKINDFKNTQFLDIEDSDNLKTQDKVTIIGYPLGQDRLKYTTGIFSGLQDGLLQTDAPINPGNSGGPMLNEKGKVVGINASKIKSSVADNVGYAVPTKHFLVVKKLMMSKNSHPRIIFQPEFLANFDKTDKDLKEYYNSSKECKLGVRVRNIYPKSPLIKAGIKEDDILCQVEYLGKKYKIDNFGEISAEWANEKISLNNLLFRFTEKDKVKFSYWRKSNQKLVSGETKFTNKSIYDIREKFPPVEPVEYVAFGGISVMELTLNHLQPKIRYQIHNFENFHYLSRFFDPTNQTKTALILTHVFPGSAVYTSEVLKKGDIINKVNNIPVSNLIEYKNAMKKIRKLKNKMFLVIETVNGRKSVLDFKAILKDEKGIMEENNYKSELYSYFVKKK